MPRFEPFPGLRYDAARCAPADVTAPPYDVLDDEDRAALCARHVDNVVIVDLPLAEGGADPYAGADATLRRWRADGVLVQDEPSFYVYRMSWTDESGPASTTGVLGALTLSPPGAGDILPHERTTPKAKSDRLQLLRATRVNLSPIWGLSPVAGLSDLLACAHAPQASFTADDGVTHDLWAITDPDRQAAIAAAVGSAPIVIADGHHRFETSLAYRDERRAAGDEDPGAEATLAWVVELAEHELRVGPIHRVITGLAPGTDLADELSSHFVAHPEPDAGAAAAWVEAGHGPALLTEAGAWRLEAKPEAVAGLADLDSARVDAALFGVAGAEVTYQHGVANVVRRIAAGDVQAGVLIRPATIAQILAIANGGDRMPPKTTFFAPKPRTGMVFRALD